MQTVDITANLTSIDFAPSDELTEVIQNVKTILTTMKYSVPLDRNFGIIADALDAPMPIAKAKISSDIVRAIQTYEPRAKVKSVSFSGDGATGQLTPTVRIEIA